MYGHGLVPGILQRSAPAAQGIVPFVLPFFPGALELMGESSQAFRWKLTQSCCFLKTPAEQLFGGLQEVALKSSGVHLLQTGLVLLRRSIYPSNGAQVRLEISGNISAE